MAPNSETLTPPPTIDEVYSGSPSRLFEAAVAVKTRLHQGSTLPPTQPRRSTLRLPPDVALGVFKAAIDEIKTQIGNSNVVVNDRTHLEDGWYLELPNTHDAYHIVDQDELVASAMIYPGSTSEVQAVVRWANKYSIPIYPISLGRNIGYGGAAPRVPGGVVVDLGRRMHDILSIDGENASCVVEPGVTYFRLYEEIQKRSLPLWVDTPDLGGGSVLGNAIDRGVGYTPYGDHFGNHCGMEVVLPNGELLRTGMGAMPGPDGKDNPTWQSFQNAYGPAIDGIFSQSNFGIITKMGFHLMPSANHKSYAITFPRDDNFEEIIDIIRPLAQKRIFGNTPQLRHILEELAVTGNSKASYWKGKGPMPRDEISKAARKLPLGECSWVFYGTQYGLPETITSQLNLIKEAFTSRIKGSRFLLPEDLPPDHYLNYRALVCSGVPGLTELNWLNWVPNGAHIFFSPIAPTRGKDAKILHTIIAQLHTKYGFDLMPTLCVSGREMHYITSILYNRGDPDEKSRAVRLMREMIMECAKKGFGEYRTHLLFADQVARTYSWGDQALMRFNEKIKDALDPNGVLAPGRNGIWPKRFRGKGWELGEADVDMKKIGPRI